MINALVLAPLLTLVSGGILGYLLGRYHLYLLNKIRTLQDERAEPPTPGVTYGAYVPPARSPINEQPDRKVGIVASKTPQRMEWETKQAIEKEALGH